ncbi:Copia protein, partial [Fragariocoptes setiger]
MHDVHFVPKVSENLFSLSSAAKKGLRVLIESDSIVFLKDDTDLFRANQQNGVYLLDLQVECPSQRALSAATVEEWHQRYGHASVDVIKKMYDLKVVEGLNITWKRQEVCEDCALSKVHRCSHPSKTPIKIVKPGVSLHMDTVGPLNTASIAGSKYFLLSKDEDSAYKHVSFVSSKADIPNEVKLIVSKVETEIGVKVLKLTTDNGMEFVNDSLGEYLKDRGINHNVSAPYVPRQNGFIEHEVQTVTNVARTMLNRSKLPNMFWAEAVRTAVYVLNRTIGSRDPEHTPYKKWWKAKPDVSNFNIFGQLAVIKTPDQQRSGKFGKKSHLHRLHGCEQHFSFL